MTSDGIEAAESPLTAADVGVMALLQLLTELRLQLGLDPDGSDTAGRFRGVLGEHLQIGNVVSSPGQTWDSGAAPAIATLADRVKRGAPVLARIARRNGKW